MGVVLRGLQLELARVILYCRRCHQAYGSAGELPVVCPSCQQPTRWGTTPPHSQAPADAARPPLRFTRDDVTFLRALCIDPEVDAPS